jgi:hypothetical protein
MSAEIGQQLGGAVAARLELEQLGLVSISVVVAWPERKVSSAMTFSRNGMLVFTPRMRNSRSARSMRWQAMSKVAAHGGELHQHRVVVRRDDRAGVAHAGVERMPKPRPSGS